MPGLTYDMKNFLRNVTQDQNDGLWEVFKSLRNGFFGDPSNGYEKIKAIKYARDKSGLGLKEAKDLVEFWIDSPDIKSRSNFLGQSVQAFGDINESENKPRHKRLIRLRTESGEQWAQDENLITGLEETLVRITLVRLRARLAAMKEDGQREQRFLEAEIAALETEFKKTEVSE